MNDREWMQVWHSPSPVMQMHRSDCPFDHKCGTSTKILGTSFVLPEEGDSTHEQLGHIERHSVMDFAACVHFQVPGRHDACELKPSHNPAWE